MSTDRDMSSWVLPEHVREAREKTDPKLSDEDVAMLPEDKKLVPLALARRLKRESVYLPLEDVEGSYHVVCEQYDAKPVGRVLLHALVKNLKAAGIITLNEKFELGLNGLRLKSWRSFLSIY